MSANPRFSTVTREPQFTSQEFTGRLEPAGFGIRLDGRGRALANVFTVRLRRMVKYADVSLKEYASVGELMKGWAACFRFYNHKHPHLSLCYRTQSEVCKTENGPTSLT